MENLTIDTQDERYFNFKRIRSSRALYFFKDSNGQKAYKVFKKMNRYKCPILDFKGGYLCDHLEQPTMTLDEWNECVRVYNNSLARRKRLKARISDFNGYVYFVTLTFTDDELKATTDSRRHHKVNPLLKTLKSNYGLIDYVGTKEYGRKTDREHYHFLMCFDKPLPRTSIKTIKTSKGQFRDVLKGTPIETEWNGLVDVAEVVAKNKDGLLSYICKVAGYIDKDSGKTQHLIYASVGHREQEDPTKHYDVDEDGFILLTEEQVKEFWDIF